MLLESFFEAQLLLDFILPSVFFIESGTEVSELYSNHEIEHKKKAPNRTTATKRKSKAMVASDSLTMYIMSVQPSRVMTWKMLMIEINTLSNL